MANHSSILDLENPADRGAWWATVHGVSKSRTQLRNEAQAQFKKRIGSIAVVLTQVILPPAGYLARSGDIFWVSQLEVLLASVGRD